jgi:hypothetical protein
MQFTSRRRPAPRIGRVALRRGLILGPLNGIVSSLLTVLAATVLTRFGGLLTVLSFPLACIFFLLAGVLAARVTGRVASGTLAGLWTGIISKVLSTLLVAIFFLTFQLPRLTGRPVPISRLEPFFLLESLYLLLDVGLGIGFGALGGLIGKSGSQVQVPSSPFVSSTQTARSPAYVMPALPVEYIASAPPPEYVPPSPPAPPPVSPDPYPYGKPFFPLYDESDE